MKNLLLIVIAILGFSAVSFGQTNSVTNATASATIIKALTLEQTVPLDFGTTGALNTATSTVVLAVDGNRTGTADLVGTDGVAGEFEITGEVNGVVAVTLPTAGTTQIVGTGAAAGGDDMTITGASWVTDAANLSSVSLGGTGIVTLKVGATLNVGINQLAGPYQGTYTVTVNYN